MFSNFFLKIRLSLFEFFHVLKAAVQGTAVLYIHIGFVESFEFLYTSFIIIRPGKKPNKILMFSKLLNPFLSTCVYFNLSFVLPPCTILYKLVKRQ